jgi:uncharacterized protein (DUF58 family)
MFGKRKTRLTVDGWYYVAIMGFLLAGAVVRDINLLFGVFGLMLASLVWHWQHGVVSLKRLTVRRHAPRRIAAGDPLTIDLTAHNGRRRGVSWAVVVEDALRRDQGTDPPIRVRLVFSRLGPREDGTQTYEGQLTRRGRYVFGPLRATTRFPLGLVRRTAVIDGDRTLLVVPRQGRLTDRWRQREQQLAHASRGSQQRLGSVDGDFHSLRPYRSGDSRHLIHWRTSARQGQLMVRQFERQQTHDLAVFLDLWQPAHAGGRERETVELAVSLAATLLADRCRRSGSRLLLAVSGAEPKRVRGAASASLLNDVMENLALAEASPHVGLADLLENGWEQMPADADAVLITTRRPLLAGETPLASITADPHQRACLERMLVIDASQQDLFDYFEP